jgi:tetratricopeptide (TPR) repeat protein
VGRAAVFSETGDLEKAVKSFEQAVSLNPDNIAAIHLKGMALENYGEFKRALIEFDRVIEIYPEFSEAWCIKGTTLKEMKLFSEAENAFRHVIKAQPSDARTWMIRGIAFAGIGNYENALVAYNKSLSLDPYSSETKIRKSLLLSTCPIEKYRNGQKALTLLKEIKESEPGIYGALASAYAELGNFPKAIQNQKLDIEYLKALPPAAAGTKPISNSGI